jgi:hypothetical protein
VFYIPEIEDAIEERKVEASDVNISSGKGGVRVSRRQSTKIPSTKTTTTATVSKKLVKKSTTTN